MPPRRPVARPQCEPLEPREVLSAAALGWAPPPEIDTLRQALAQAHVLAQQPGRAFLAEVEVDLDADGLAEVVRLHRPEGRNTFELLITSTGPDGEATLRASLTMSETAEGLMLADFDGDSRTDLFVSCSETGDGALLLGRSDGTVSVSRPVAARVALAVADLDGDGDDDFVLAGSGPEPLTVELTGGGRKVIGDEATGPLAPGTIHLADLNGDAVLDLAVGDLATGRLLIYPGLGHGEFGAEVHRGRGLALGPGLMHVASARLHEHSPYADLVLVSEMTGEVSVLSGGPDFKLYVTAALKVGIAPSAALVEDVTGDGLADLVVTSRREDRAWIVPGRGEGAFDVAATRVLVTGRAPAGAVAGDFDGDGKMDLITLDSGGSDLSFYSDVASAASARQEVSAGVSGPTAAVVGDVNGDGVSDLYVGGEDDGVLALLLGGASGPRLNQTETMPRAGPLALAPASSSPSGGPGVYALTEGSDSPRWVPFQGPTEPTPRPAEPSSGRPGLFSPSGSGLGAVVVELQPLGPALFGLVPTLLVAGPDWASDPGLGGAVPEAALLVVSARPTGEEAAEGPPPEGDAADAPSPAETSGAVGRYLLGLDDVSAPALAPDGTSELPAPAAGPVLAAPGEPAPPAEQPPPREPLAAEDDLVASACLALALAGGVIRRRRAQPEGASPAPPDDAR